LSFNLKFEILHFFVLCFYQCLRVFIRGSTKKQKSREGEFAAPSLHFSALRITGRVR
jgi:hypothetical protein